MSFPEEKVFPRALSFLKRPGKTCGAPRREESIQKKLGLRCEQIIRVAAIPCLAAEDKVKLSRRRTPEAEDARKDLGLRTGKSDAARRVKNFGLPVHMLMWIFLRGKKQRPAAENAIPQVGFHSGILALQKERHIFMWRFFCAQVTVSMSLSLAETPRELALLNLLSGQR